MRRTLLLSIGWVATATLTIATTALVLSNNNADAALSQREVRQRLAETPTPSPKPVPTKTQPVKWIGKNIVTRGGVVAIGCRASDGGGLQVSRRNVPKPGWRVRNHGGAVLDIVAQAHGAKLASATNATLLYRREVAPGGQSLDEPLYPEPKYRGKVTVVITWCEKDRERWSVVDW